MLIKRLICVLFLFYSVFLCYSQQLIWDEDFSSNKNGWYTDESTVYLEKGVYVFNAQKDNAASWRTTAIKDCKISVETKWLGGLDSMGAGLIFRLQSNQQFYIFWIAAQGYYIIGKIDGNNITRFANWTQSNSINKKGTNTLTVECMGSDITCYANDKKLLTTNDASYASGGFGFYCQKGVQAGFDNLKVWEYTEAVADAASMEIVKSYVVPGKGPYGIAYVKNSVSIVDWFDGQIVTLNPANGKTQALFKLSGLYRYQAMEFDNERVLVSDYNKKINVYDTKGKIIKTIKYDGIRPSGLTYGNGYFWVLDSGEMKIKQYQNWKLMKTVSIPKYIVNPRGLEYENNALWLASPTNESVYKIDPASGLELAKFDLKGINVHGLEWINNYLWITDHSNKKVMQLKITEKKAATPVTENKENKEAAKDEKQVWKLAEIKKWEMGCEIEHINYNYSGAPGNITIEYLDDRPGLDVKHYIINWQWNEIPAVIKPDSYLDITAQGKLLKSERMDSYGWFLSDVSSTFNHGPGFGGDYLLGANEFSMKGSGDCFKWLPYPKGKVKMRKGNKGDKIAIRIGFLTGGSEYYSYYYIFEWIE